MECYSYYISIWKKQHYVYHRDQFSLISDNAHKKLPPPQRISWTNKADTWWEGTSAKGLSCKDLCGLRIYTNGGTNRKAQISILYCHGEEELTLLQVTPCHIWKKILSNSEQLVSPKVEWKFELSAILQRSSERKRKVFFHF